MTEIERKAWSRDELLLAINLYCKTPFGRIHVRNPEIIELANLLKRSPGSVSYKLANFASIDPSLARKGASNFSKLDKEVWDEFFENWDEMAFISEKISSEVRGEQLNFEGIFLIPEGRTRESIIRTRVNQSFFRKMVLSSYDYACCITGMPLSDLLVASHIIPWSKDEKNRINPRNGLCLNSLHDKAFDVGLITIDEEFRIMLSSKVKNLESQKAKMLSDYDRIKIRMPKRFIPDQKFLSFHRKNIFVS
jgi:putative restriction endonuclease